MRQVILSSTFSFVVTLAALLAAAPVHASSITTWKATSTDAMAITGNITVRGDTLTFGNGAKLSLIPVATREGMWSPLPQRRTGTIYKLDPPSDPKLLGGNTLCGMSVTYIVLSQRDADSLSLSAFTGKKPPAGFGDHSCAAYFYERR